MSIESIEESIKQMVGRKLKSVELEEDKEKITFYFEDGTKKSFRAGGDCCSSSWIEHLTLPDKVEGATILSAREAGMEPWDGHKCEETKRPYGVERRCGHDSLKVYHTIFQTDQGEIVLEYRNDSNGYYGGYLVDKNA